MVGGDEALALSDAAITLAGATATAGHACYMQTEDGGAASAAGAAGGLLHISTGDGSAGAAGANNGAASGALSIVTGTGGAGGNNAATGGAGGVLAITAGAGGASASGGTSTGGAGGYITLTPGAGGTGDTAGIAGIVHIDGMFTNKATAGSMTDTAAITVAQMLGKLINGIPTAAANYTTPTGAELSAAMTGVATGSSFWLVINNNSSGANTITVVAGATGVTMDGTVTVAQNVSRSFFCNCTGANTWVIYGC